MDFARRVLNKYGWKEGEGLGKHNNGIVKPLKASMKFDNAGLGSDQAATEFNNHWWERVFNDSASNVKITSAENGVRVDLKNKDDRVEISTKGYSLKKLKKAKETSSSNDGRYDNFLKSATLTKSGDEIENPDKIAVGDISVTKYKTLTDEELFQACGGRTAHKGARHGLKLSGKLSRIEQQEKELLARMQERMNGTPANGSSTEKLKKNRRKKSTNIEAVTATNSASGEVPIFSEGSVEEEKIVDQHCVQKSSKKHKKKKNKDVASYVADDDAPAEAENLKRKKTKRQPEEDTTFTTEANIVNESTIPGKKRKGHSITGGDAALGKPTKQSKESSKKKHAQ